jgi:hypothetical protein
VYRDAKIFQKFVFNYQHHHVLLFRRSKNSSSHNNLMEAPHPFFRNIFFFQEGLLSLFVNRKESLDPFLNFYDHLSSRHSDLQSGFTHCSLFLCHFLKSSYESQYCWTFLCLTFISSRNDFKNSIKALHSMATFYSTKRFFSSFHFEATFESFFSAMNAASAMTFERESLWEKS